MDMQRDDLLADRPIAGRQAQLSEVPAVETPAVETPGIQMPVIQMTDEFDSDLEGFTSVTAPRARDGASSMDEWEDRIEQNTAGYASNPLTTSFTDLDLGQAQLELRNTAAWAQLQFEVDR